MYLSANSTTNKPNKLAYALALLLCVLQVAINSIASAQMQMAHENAGENIMVVCTGKGMVYINESVFLESGKIEYLTADGSNGNGDIEAGMDTEIVSSCTVAVQSDNPTYSLDIEQAEVLASARSIANFTLNQHNYLRDTYLCALSRAPPIFA